MNRRQFMQSVAAGAILIATDAQGRSDVEESDPKARMLEYVKESPGTDTCATCKLYQSSYEQDGKAPCPAFPGQLVEAAGWCKIWID